MPLGDGEEALALLLIQGFGLTLDRALADAKVLMWFYGGDQPVSSEYVSEEFIHSAGWIPLPFNNSFFQVR